MDERYTTLINADALLPHLDDPYLLIVDCTFYLQFPDQGNSEYKTCHIPNAVYADLNRDLSSKGTPTTGRHPLPNEQKFNTLLQSWGLKEGTQVVAYDSSGGSMAAARLWWLLNYYGFTSVAILDGGFINWLRNEYPTSTGVPVRSRSSIHLKPDPHLVCNAMEIRENYKTYVLLDARATNRYHGLEEVIDPAGGHIPGAISSPATDYIDDEMFFKPKSNLQKKFHDLIGNSASSTVVHYCGSGVTAALGAFAMVYAGYPMPRLYPGSWSEWIKFPWAEIAVHD